MDFSRALSVYSSGMDFTPYLRELDEELAQLKAIRRMFMELREPVLTDVAAPVKVAAVETVAAAAEPTLTVVPAKQRREYHRRSRGPVEQKAIGAPIPERPVFVKPMVVAAPAKVEKPEPELDVAALEAAMRRKLLGDAA